MTAKAFPGKTKLAFAAIATMVAVALPASAGERTAVSALASLPKVKDATTPPALLGVPGLKVQAKRDTDSTYSEATAAIKKGYCLVQYNAGFIDLQLTDSVSGGVVEELWHFVEADGKATLEQFHFEMTLDNAWVKSKATVELHRVASEAGITVWGYREPTGTVMLLASGASGGREAMAPGEHADLVGSSCSFGATRIDAASIAKGAVAQLSGSLPVEEQGATKIYPRFSVDISATKLSRDPESMLSVRVRRLEH